MSTPITKTTTVREKPHAPVSHVEPLRELAHRVGGGIEVTLYWSADDGETSVEVRHPGSDQTLFFSVARERALDAFYHPFSHLPVSRDFEAA